MTVFRPSGRSWARPKQKEVIDLTADDDSPAQTADGPVAATLNVGTNSLKSIDVIIS
jgi:hypothetical protein